jgi:hypothetical protein
MKLRACSLLSISVLVAAFIGDAGGAEPKPYSGASCQAPVDDFFLDEVWAKVGSQRCLTCHKVGGDAEESRFVLQDPLRSQGQARQDALRHNRNAFATMAKLKEHDGVRLLLKVTGGLDHGGSEVLKRDSTGYGILAEFARRVNAPSAATAAAQADDDDKRPPFFDGIAMLDDRRLLRRAALSLVGRLPTAAELAAVAKDGRPTLAKLLDAMMQEEAFYDRLREGFNDIFLTVGFIGNPEQAVLAYENFSKTRGWYQKHDLSHIADEAERKKAGYKLADDYRAALRAEPMKLVEYIVRNNRPFTEIATADYILVNPYSARGYGVFEEVREQFKDPNDLEEFIPVKLKALTSGNKLFVQDSATGYYPHAGLLSTFQFLRRYPTTETNRNRLRSRMYYQYFLGIDTLELAARVADAAAVTAKFEIPTMQASECVVCHKTLDPVAGLFQDFYSFEGVFGKRKEGWYKDMFAAGFEGEDLPEADRWRALQWLGERTTMDPRFAVAMVEHVYYILMGRKVLLPPKDLDDPLYRAKRRAYKAQRAETERIATHFAAEGFNLKQVFQDWIVSDFYRVDGPTSLVDNPERRAELDDVGLVRMLSPEQLERKTAAIFGERWGKLGGQLGMLYGDIDSKEVTERATDPSGAMGAIQRIYSNDVACKQTLRDFARPAAERRLFPGIERNVVPGKSAADDLAIRRAIVYLHERILGRDEATDSPDVERTWQLFAGIVADAAAQPSHSKTELYECRSGVADFAADPDYTIRAWRAVVTYLLRRPDYLYE